MGKGPAVAPGFGDGIEEAVTRFGQVFEKSWKYEAFLGGFVWFVGK